MAARGGLKRLSRRRRSPVTGAVAALAGAAGGQLLRDRVA